MANTSGKATVRSVLNFALNNLLIFLIATREYIEDELKPKGMDFSEYINLVKEAFAAQDLTKKKFSYGIQKGDTSNQLKVRLITA